MSQQLIVVIALVAVALVSAVIVLVILINRRRPQDGNALLVQLDHVRAELRGLSDLFRVPQTRGAVGETLLYELLRSWLPERGFETQYSFPNGARADAVIRVGSRLVAVDSKYPQEAVGTNAEELTGEARRAVARHITDIAGKYIVPDAGTMPFALMYIPSERLYQRLFASRDQSLMQTALEHNVVPASPSTLFVYLQTVSYGLRGMALSSRASEILNSVERLQHELRSFRKRFELAQTHLRNLTKAIDDADTDLLNVQRATDRLLVEPDDAP